MTDLSRVVRFAQIACAPHTDQAGRTVIELYALDASGALWATREAGLPWERVVQPSDSTVKDATHLTMGLKQHG